MNCPKCGQASLVIDEEGDAHCFMCSYNASTRLPTLDEAVTTTRQRLWGSYGDEDKHTEASFNARALREPLPLLKRRRINWNTRNIKTKPNKNFNGRLVA